MIRVLLLFALGLLLFNHPGLDDGTKFLAFLCCFACIFVRVKLRPARAAQTGAAAGTARLRRRRSVPIIAGCVGPDGHLARPFAPGALRGIDENDPLLRMADASSRELFNYVAYGYYIDL